MNRFHHSPQDLIDQSTDFFARLNDNKNYSDAINNRLALFLIFAVLSPQIVILMLFTFNIGFWGIVIGPIFLAGAIWYNVNFLFSPLIVLLDAFRSNLESRKKPLRSSAYRKVFFRTWRRYQNARKEGALQRITIGAKSAQVRELSDEKKKLLDACSNETEEVDRLGTKLRKEVESSARLRAQISRLQKDFTAEKERALDAERRRAAAVRDGKSKLEKSQRGVLSDVPMERLVHFFTEQCADGKISDVATDDIGALYAVMHKYVPDMERVKEMSLIPNEILRAQQTQTLNNYYSDLIKGVENDETLSPEEKEDKISIYRMSREQEFGTYS